MRLKHTTYYPYVHMRIPDNVLNISDMHMYVYNDYITHPRCYRSFGIVPHTR